MGSAESDPVAPSLKIHSLKPQPSQALLRLQQWHCGPVEHHAGTLMPHEEGWALAYFAAPFQMLFWSIPPVQKAQGNRQVLGPCAQPLLSQQRCYWHHGRWDEKSKQSAVELTKGSFAVQNTLGGYLQCSSGRPVYLMKQQPSSFRVICTFCQQNVFSIPIFAFIVIPPEVCMQDKWPSQWGYSAGHGPALHSRERLTRANGPKQCPHLSCLDWWVHFTAIPAALLHGQMGSPGALPEQAQLCRCGQPLSQILSLFHSWLPKASLP